MRHEIIRMIEDLLEVLQDEGASAGVISSVEDALEKLEEEMLVEENDLDENQIV